MRTDGPNQADRKAIHYPGSAPCGAGSGSYPRRSRPVGPPDAPRSLGRKLKLARTQQAARDRDEARHEALQHGATPTTKALKMKDFEFSPQFTDLVRCAALQGTVEECDDRYEIWRPTSVVYVVKRAHGEYCLGSYERADPPSFDFFTTDLALIERCLIADFCSDCREDIGFPRLDIYRMARSLKDGVEAYMLDDRYSTLRDTHTGNSYPMRIRELSGIPLAATHLSHIVTVPIEELFAAYLTPNGAPLFAEFIYERGLR